MPVIRLLGLIIGLISLVLIVISVAIPYWIYVVDKEVNVKDTHYVFKITANTGFWEYCFSIDYIGIAESECGKLYESDRTDMTDASAAMLLLGMLSMAGSVVMCGISLLCMKESKLFPIVGGVCAFFAGTSTLIGVIIYGYENWYRILQYFNGLYVTHLYGPCFYMAIVATFFALVSGGMQIANSGLLNVSVKPNGINWQMQWLSWPHSWR